jgi:phage baseplate assembly protein W
MHMRAALRNKMRKNLGRELTDNLYAPSIAVRKNMVKVINFATSLKLWEGRCLMKTVILAFKIFPLS